MAVNNNYRPIRNPYVVLREEFDDWAVLFNPDAALGFAGFGLSPTGVYLWKLLDGEHTFDNLAEALRRDSEEVPQGVGEHVLAFIEALVEEGLAGYGRVHTHDDKGRVPPHSTCAGTTKFRYEPPKLFNLSGQQAAHGDCTNGSSDTNNCASGPVYCIYSSCTDGGCALSSYCVNGGTAGTNCLGGNSAPGGGCSCGGSGSKPVRTCYDGCNTLKCFSGSGA